MLSSMRLPDDVREFFRKQGKIGAAKRHAILSPERRREIARQAIAARWAKAKLSKKANATKSKRRGAQ